MTSIRKCLYATLLAFTTLSIAPALASAQDTHGEFTLPHDVRWQNAMVPAGEYRFSYTPDGAMGLLTLAKMSGARTGFVLLVSDTDEIREGGVNQLVLESTSDGSYVSAMKLPEFGMTLHFSLPKSGKLLAKGVTAPLAPGQ